MAGYQKIYRSIQEHWLWDDKPFSRGQAFIDLILSVNHCDKKILIGGELIEVKRGSKITSIRKLGDTWGWSTVKVKKFLEQLQKDNMITYKSDNKKTVVAIENYSVFQDGENTEQSQNNHRTITEQSQKNIKSISEQFQKNTNKNDKEYIKNDKECKEGKEYIAKEKKHKYGEYKHVLLTEDQHTQLINELGISIANASITYLDEYIEMKGYKAKNHYLCIKKWVIDAVKKKNKTSGTTNNLKNLFKEAQDEENGISADTDNPF